MEAQLEHRMMLSSEGHERRRVYHCLKRLLDIVVSLIALIVFFPLMVLIGLLIVVTSSGPAIFRQERIGSRRRWDRGLERWIPTPFTMYKFRTMRRDTDSSMHRAFVTAFINHDTSSMSAIQGDKTAITKIVNDPRITPLGRFLRKSSLDELPQLWNILIGDMSLVGPRPPLAYEVEEYQPWHWRRLQAKPGLTGFWQVSGRSSTTFDDMVEMDIWYSEQTSLLLDLKILLRTVTVVLSGKGGL